ncbi:7341_t:CDS:1, partial [Scutellospora calospora]
MSTIESENTQTLSESDCIVEPNNQVLVSDTDQNISQLKKKSKKKLAPVYEYLDVFEDGTRVCKICDKSKCI